MKKFYLFFLFVFAATTHLSAAPKTDWYLESEDLIFQKANEYLVTHPLQPVIKGKIGLFFLLGFAPSSTPKMAYPIGKGVYGDEVYDLFFSAIKNQDGMIEVDLLYLAKGGQLPTPRLFTDVYTLAAVKAPAILKMNPCYGLIEPDSPSRGSTGEIFQTWSFFNSKSIETLAVTLISDGKGGTNFTIRDKN